MVSTEGSDRGGPAPRPGWMTLATVSPMVIATSVFINNNRGRRTASGPAEMRCHEVCTIAARISGGASAPEGANQFAGHCQKGRLVSQGSPVATPNITPMMMRPYSGRLCAMRCDQARAAKSRRPCAQWDHPRTGTPMRGSSGHGQSANQLCPDLACYGVVDTSRSDSAGAK